MGEKQPEFIFDSVLFKEKDRNRELMIKYKYNRITEDELNQLHNGLSKLIYKIIHSNNIYIDTEEIYQEVWLKIAKSKHTWNETKGTFVSTWVSLVCQSVCNTLRKSLLKRRSCFCLYEDLKGEEIGVSSEDFITNKGLIEEETVFGVFIKKEEWEKFISKLDEKEKEIVLLSINTTPDDVRKICGKNVCANRITKKFLMKKLNLRTKVLDEYLEAIKLKMNKDVE